ncbi:MAG TPA: hypothetical protein DDW94_08325 [Deltaproteobacteria bacterium]|nr:MAG: hypothetical protein A2Z79_02850 [Deltaproteobacteria bacterium GWA2_55_82]OGQ64315.1 MAG: hypothetical protein A3I81_04290 [Deltaproteobacteria bacterium RIFCSPLOWO2_02_FULL_55_12]OIJ74339.1 MAG: hypothetical protein A2V21_308750 [Deltaproteobacteria bacterium GWC2_55_46]HBG46980.1 hypothetical protein [Deltaproteobacteria bacterium]HCY10960.1 hypothetical protein [Deltaproteobacteria bacterium]
MRNPTSSSSSQSKYPFLEPAQGGVSIRVRLQPRSSRDRLEGVQGNSLKIRLTAPPVEGEANKALIEFLSGLIGVRKSAFRIESGHKAREKKVFVEGVYLSGLEKIFSESLP